MRDLLNKFLFLILILPLFQACSSQEKDKGKVSITEPHQASDDIYEAGGSYRLVWADEFDGDSLNMANWNYQVEPAGRFNDEWQRYTNSQENAFVKDGNLIIKAIHDGQGHDRDQYSSARLNTAGKQSWQYGKIVAKIKLPQGQGIWPAFWMLGANINENGGDTPWPQCGEIDILELYGSKNDGLVEANLHYANEANNHAMMGARAYELAEGKFADAYHVFELAWDEGKISWLVDGDEYAAIEIAGEEFSEFHKEFFILFNIAVGGKWAGRPDETTQFPQMMYVDWVRVYQKAE